MVQRVLIVDDHSAFRAFARGLLARAGYEVVGEAADARSALDAVRRTRPDVVVLDVQLPDGDGFAVAQAMAGEGSASRVILISSRDAEDLGSRLRCAGLPFIPKARLSADALSAALTT